MTKQEFMYRLAQQLISLPPEERVCALKFYDEYFADAGEENADAVIRDLGSPEEVARTIKEDFAQRNPGYDPGNQYTYRPGPQYQPGQGRQTYTTSPETYRQRGQAEPQVYRQGMSGGTVVLIVTLLILGSPIWLALLVAAIGVFLALAGVVIGLVVAAVAATGALVLGGVSCAWAAITALAITPGLRLLGVGGGLLLTGIGLLAALLGIWIAVHVLPALFRGVVDLCRRLFHRKGGN